VSGAGGEAPGPPRYGDYVPVRFKVDTGADLSAVPVSTAQQVGINFSRSSPGIAGGLVGAVPKYRGTIQTLIAGVRYEWPCDFLETPSGLSTASSLLPVLGRAGFLDAFDVCISGGFLTLARRNRFREWQRNAWRKVRSWFTGERSTADPL
jgi:hypothetical protein